MEYVVLPSLFSAVTTRNVPHRGCFVSLGVRSSVVVKMQCEQEESLLLKGTLTPCHGSGTSRPLTDGPLPVSRPFGRGSTLVLQVKSVAPTEHLRSVPRVAPAVRTALGCVFVPFELTVWLRRRVFKSVKHGVQCRPRECGAEDGAGLIREEGRRKYPGGLRDG